VRHRAIGYLNAMVFTVNRQNLSNEIFVNLGDPGLAPTPAAIGNAVADAIGVRVYDLPLKPENVYWAMQKKKKSAA
jgi:hypothetical protein